MLFTSLQRWSVGGVLELQSDAERIILNYFPNPWDRTGFELTSSAEVSFFMLPSASGCRGDALRVDLWRRSNVARHRKVWAGAVPRGSAVSHGFLS